MIVLFCAFVSAAWGAMLARKRQGRRLDMAQYAGGFGIFGAIIGLFITVAISRMA